jgi:pre-mRNA-splicing factor SYF2
VESYIPATDQLNQTSSRQDDPPTEGTAEDVPAATEEEKPLTEEQIEEATSGMTETQKRLFKIRMKINQGRKANKAEVEKEFKRFSDPSFAKREYAAEKREGGQAGQENGSGGKKKNRGGADAYLLETAEMSEKRQQKAERKEFNRATFGWEAFTVEAGYKAYSKKLGASLSLFPLLSCFISFSLPALLSSPLERLPPPPPAHQILEQTSSSSVSSDPLQYGKAGTAVSAAGLNRLVADMQKTEENRSKWSRRRATHRGDTVDSINDRNEHFNKKIKRSYDKYTVEIRQNIERGTAL